MLLHWFWVSQDVLAWPEIRTTGLLRHDPPTELSSKFADAPHVRVVGDVLELVRRNHSPGKGPKKRQHPVSRAGIASLDRVHYPPDLGLLAVRFVPFENVPGTVRGYRPAMLNAPLSDPAGVLRDAGNDIKLFSVDRLAHEQAQVPKDAHRGRRGGNQSAKVMKAQLP